MRTPFFAVVACVVTMTTGFAARQEAPAADRFEVASIRRNTNLDGAGGWRTQPGGRFTATNISTLTLIQTAYGFEPYRIVGAPGWARTERYDISAAGAETTNAEQRQARLRALLADRFGLVARTERREMQTYALLRARADGQLGPNLKPWTIDCKTYKPKPDELRPVQTIEDLARPRPCGMSGGSGLLVAGGRPMATLVGNLAGDLQVPVTDHTGLTGDYEMSLRWNPDPARGDSPFPALFTALQEQLGLKLESRRESIEVLVVDRLDRPSEN